MPVAGTLSCPQCGAAAQSDATACAFCRARLATVACPACFGLVFVGSRHCAHCGARAKEPKALDGTPWTCPAGHGELRGIAIGGAEIGECPACAGLWIDEPTFQAVVADRTRPLVVPQGGAEDAARRTVAESRVRYRPCCDCGKLMNRVNFAKSSGIVLDACKGHGLWCDVDELRQVMEFVRAGGLDAARQREQEQLELERRQKEFVQRLDGQHELHQRPMQRRIDAVQREDGRGLSILLSLLGR